MNSDRDAPLVDTIDSMVSGFIAPARAHDIAREYPAVVSSVAVWIRDSAAAGNWSRVERLANLAAPLAAPGLGEVLCSIIERDISGLNTEDLVEILGDIGASEAAGSIFRMLQRRIAFDKPAYWLAQKSILALSEFGTEEADEYLRDMTRSDWPDPVRWHAAVALCVEDDLGFDEDRMLGHS